MLKAREAMSSRGNNPMDGVVRIDEFVLGGREETKVGRSYNVKKKKAITALRPTEDGKAKGMYAMKIDDFSAQSLQYIFINQISRNAKITTDKWMGSSPVANAYNIIESNVGLNFKPLHTMIYDVKSWIRTTYSWVSGNNLNKYFNEFCFRINRSQNKATIFNNLIVKMLEGNKINQSELISN